LILIGFLLALADTRAHLPKLFLPGDFRSGLSSAIFSVGLIISGLVLAFTAYFELQKT
jgi:hypothetical protein